MTLSNAIQLWMNPLDMSMEEMVLMPVVKIKVKMLSTRISRIGEAVVCSKWYVILWRYQGRTMEQVNNERNIA